VRRGRRRLRCLLRDADGDRVTLLAGRRQHDFPSSVRPALAELLATGELKVGDLPGLSAEDQIELARRLVTESVAVVPDAVPGGASRG
jgi:bifunctional lysine-specific demethylase and histidyl-hydroxylase NO66